MAINVAIPDDKGQLAAARKPTVAGKVFLVGAGPGDPGLFTIKGRQILCNADVILYDYLANPELLNDAKADAELIYVGFHAKQRLSQEQINEILLTKAREGKTVCRLKGGDPFVFARGGEEAECLAEAGIAWEVIPGVSAGHAVPAYAGIPLTHRAFSSSVLFITGHEGAEKDFRGNVDWQKIANGAETLVFFMGVTNLPEIAENLILAGRAFSTPVALIRWGTRGQQEVVSGTLATIVDRVRAAGLKPPALAVVGDVVRLREKLKWFEKLPLFGERILITRAREQAAALSQPLRALGAETIELPSIAIENPEDWSPLDSALRRLGKYDWLIFTSANGVRKFAERMGALGIDIRALGKAKLCAIGPATARELGQLHLSVDLTPEQFVAEGVVKCFSRIPLRGKRVLLPRARVARDVLPEALRKRGARVDVVEAYRTVVPGRSAERAREIFERHRPTMAVFTSSSSVNNLFQLLPADYLMPYLREMKLASIGPVTSSALRARGLEAAIEPRSYTIPALIEAIRGAVEKQRAGN